MRAIVIEEYGDNDRLSIDEVPDPKVGPDTVLVRAHAVGVNPVDYKVVRGYLDGAFPVHFPLIPCWDLAGVVEAVGPAVADYAVGDAVMAYDREDHVQNGTLAELVAVPVRCLAPKPDALSFAQAAALPLAGLTAYQAVVEALNVNAADTVLVHAAAGGVGLFACQIAKLRGARVIGTASAGNHQFLQDLGIEPVPYGDALVEYVRALAPRGVDAVVDLVGGPALAASPQLMAPDGRLASVVDASVVRQLGGRYVFVRPDTVQLTQLAQWAGEGAIRVEIAATFPWEKAADAFQMVEEGHVRGKVVMEFAG